jgi:hypothetical protein
MSSSKAESTAVTTSVLPVPPRPEITVTAFFNIFVAASACFGSLIRRENLALK